MFERFILWLVTKFVSARTLTQYYVDTRFLKDPSGHIPALFHYAHSSAIRPETFPSLSQVMVNLLNKRFTLSELVFLHALEIVKKDHDRCAEGDCDLASYVEFFTRIEELKAHPSHLKVRKDLIDLMRANFSGLSEDDVVALATILQQHPINPASVATFICQPGV